MHAHRWSPMILAFSLTAQVGPEGVKPTQGRVVDYSINGQALEKRILDSWQKKDWSAIQDLVEGNTRNLEMLNLDLEHWERLGQVAEETLTILEKNTGPRSNTLRTLKALTLSRAGRHVESSKTYLENAFLGCKWDFQFACDEARAAADWKRLNDCAEAGLSVLPENLTLLEFKGEAQIKQGQYAEAASTLAAVVKKAPKRTIAWLNLSCCQNETGLYQEAHDAADQVISLDPKELGGFYNRARASLGLKLYREAREDYAMALSLEPKDPALRKNIEDNIQSIDRFLVQPAPAGKPVRRKP